MLKKIALFLFFASTCYGKLLEYTVYLDSTETHKVRVKVEVVNIKAKTLNYQMPIWAPGAYSVTHYGRYVSDFQAYDHKHHELPVKQINDDRWEISNAKDIEGFTYSVSDSHKDSTSLYFALAHIDTNFFFANGTCLFGYVNDNKNIPSVVMYDWGYTKHFKLATALDPSDNIQEDPHRRGKSDTVATTKYLIEHPTFANTAFKAKNYDELADAPVMADTGFQTRSFNDGKASYDVVLASDRKFEMDSLEYYIHKIVHAETDFFHDTPFEHYTFLVYAPTFFHSPSPGQGALEHANSSDYLLINFPWKQFKQFGPEIFSHEFFHLWNVKRIHSSLLGPFDYTKRVMTTSLWLSEGITDYYAHTLLTRYGIMPYKTFEQMIKNLSYQMQQSKAAQSETLEQLSIDESDFALDKATIFYSKGTLVGLLLDIEIRTRTNNKKSLDDVMLALNADAQKGKTFKDNELIGKMEKITGLDLQDFYHKYIAGTDSLPIDEYLKKMGVERRFNLHDESARGSATIKVSNENELFIDAIDSGSDLAKSGLKKGDTLIIMPADNYYFEHPLEFFKTKPTQFDVITTTTGQEHKRYSIKLENPLTYHTEKAYMPSFDKPTSLEVAIRHEIVGKNY